MPSHALPPQALALPPLPGGPPPDSIAHFLCELVESLNPSAFVGLLAPDGHLLHVNQAALDFAGVKAEQVLGHCFTETPWWRESETARRCLRRAIRLARRGTASRFRRWIRDREGRLRAREFSLVPLFDAQGQVVQLMPSSIELPHRAAPGRFSASQFDPITGLPNRSEMRRRLHEGLQRGEALSLLLIDLDRFKRVNDALGQAAGDELLRMASRRIQRALPEAELLAGVGGDEFAVLLRDTRPAAYAERVLQAFSHPFELQGRELFINCSIGCASASQPGFDVNELVRQAAAALQHVKSAGRNGLQVFNFEPEALDPDALLLESALRRAAERGELRLHYQPQVELASGRIVGAEALLRWRHPELGEISPARFIPIAEESGLIASIGEWVLREAIATAACWQRRGYPSLRIAVNLSGRQLRQTGLAERIESLLQDVGLDAAWLAVEVTESKLVDSFDQTSATLARLQALGVEVAIDDFGTGYSGLNYLRQLPASVVKIDRSFLGDVAAPPDQVSMTRSLIQLAHSLQLKVVAEGLEQEMHRALLSAQGCDIAQGFLISPPLPPERFEALLAAQTAQAAAHPALP